MVPVLGEVVADILVVLRGLHLRVGHRTAEQAVQTGGVAGVEGGALGYAGQHLGESARLDAHQAAQRHDAGGGGAPADLGHGVPGDLRLRRITAAGVDHVHLRVVAGFRDHKTVGLEVDVHLRGHRTREGAASEGLVQGHGGARPNGLHASPYPPGSSKPTGNRSADRGMSVLHRARKAL